MRTKRRRKGSAHVVQDFFIKISRGFPQIKNSLRVNSLRGQKRRSVTYRDTLKGVICKSLHIKLFMIV